MDDRTLLLKIKAAKQAMIDAKQIKCECSGFCLQYEGCCCERSRAIKAAETKLSEVLDMVYNTVTE